MAMKYIFKTQIEFLDPKTAVSKKKLTEKVS